MELDLNRQKLPKDERIRMAIKKESDKEKIQFFNCREEEFHNLGEVNGTGGEKGRRTAGKWR